jgi:hypothetical protein
MPTCIRCNKNISLLGRLSFDATNRQCGDCVQELRTHALVAEKARGEALSRFRQFFLSITSSRLISEEDWQSLTGGAANDRLDLKDALAYVLGDALHFLEKTLTFFYADGEISEEDDNYLRTMIQILEIPQSHAAPLLQRLGYLKNLTDIKRGLLPTVTPRVHVESDETCHLDVGALSPKDTARSATNISGQLLATNKKLYFLSQSGGFDIQWKRIMRIERQQTGVYLQLSTKKGNGYYHVGDPMYVEAVLETIVKMVNRGLVTQFSDAATRHIPQDVKTAVWQRDQGKCVQCGAASYLEFDHIIPFGKGGASTVNNVQLLCRKCNLAKGGRL